MCVKENKTENDSTTNIDSKKFSVKGELKDSVDEDEVPQHPRDRETALDTRYD